MAALHIYRSLRPAPNDARRCRRRFNGANEQRGRQTTRARIYLHRMADCSPWPKSVVSAPIRPEDRLCRLGHRSRRLALTFAALLQ